MKVYMSIPVEMLDAPQAEKLYAEMSALLAERGFEAVSNPAALQPPSPDRVWKHLACAMLLLKDCGGVLFSPAYLDLRNADRKLSLTPDSLAPRGMKYPEK